MSSRMHAAKPTVAPRDASPAARLNSFRAILNSTTNLILSRMEAGESPYACACREAQEELGLTISPSDLHLTGLVSEHGYEGRTHWLMFLFEVSRRITMLPPVHSEGRFQFFTREALAGLNIPQTDRERIWPWFWQHRGGFFAAHCHCHADGRDEWTLEESYGRIDH